MCAEKQEMGRMTGYKGVYVRWPSLHVFWLFWLACLFSVPLNMTAEIAIKMFGKILSLRSVYSVCTGTQLPLWLITSPTVHSNRHRQEQIDSWTYLLSLKACSCWRWMVRASSCFLRWDTPPPITPGGLKEEPWAKGTFMTFRAAVFTRPGGMASRISGS